MFQHSIFHSSPPFRFLSLFLVTIGLLNLARSFFEFIWRFNFLSDVDPWFWYHCYFSCTRRRGRGSNSQVGRRTREWRKLGRTIFTR
ncbi:hypothetical protein B0F90DRAFT_1732547 [Multifurca ochricompacta]|uniref:Uncharacterized protein n=1 Tax=Multifurca ochricompacta TaxID=376703 RepID=A0AAD4M305_9AGAM|nr:hypothetical protein B0F90DRAFT_1732547 [Multifurca ochricompacta]